MCVRKADDSMVLEEDIEHFTLADHEFSRSVVDLARIFVQRLGLRPNCNTFCVTELTPQEAASDV